MNGRGCEQRTALESLEYKEGAVNGEGKNVRSEVRVITEPEGQANASRVLLLRPCGATSGALKDTAEL